MSFTADIKKEIIKLKVWDTNSLLTQEEQIDRIRAREAFLSAGFMNDPHKKYHLEIIFKTKKKAEEILKILLKNSINTKIIKKGKDYMIYIKDGETISNFLAFIGVGDAVLRFEEIRVVKEIRNNINRKVNCETANLSKTVNAAITQIEAINNLKKKNEFGNLEIHLKEIAKMRIEYPDASLNTIARILKISKSGANHRLNKIVKIANEKNTDIK